VLAVGEKWDVAAIAIDPRTNKVIEQKGHKNTSIPDDLRIAIKKLTERWKEEQVVNR
jgi:ribosomal protein L31E